jgi:hypothetical protein
MSVQGKQKQIQSTHIFYIFGTNLNHTKNEHGDTGTR